MVLAPDFPVGQHYKVVMNVALSQVNTGPDMTFDVDRSQNNNQQTFAPIFRLIYLHIISNLQLTWPYRSIRSNTMHHSCHLQGSDLCDVSICLQWSLTNFTQLYHCLYHCLPLSYQQDGRGGRVESAECCCDDLSL